jgi:hypothetical protein
MNAVAHSQGRGLALLAQHLEALTDADAPTARERLEDALGTELAHLLVFALAPEREHTAAAA